MSDMLDAAIAAARTSADDAAARDDGMATRLRIRETLARRRSRRAPIMAGILATLFGSTAFAYYTRTKTTTVAVQAPPPPALVVVEAEPVAPPRVRVVERVVTPKAPEPEPVIETVQGPPRDPEIAAYGIAHDAHFKSSPLEALRQWDAYLARYPNGSLALDARYSRALVLIKLERFADARNALRPFAEAPDGSYRQAEAAKLLDALP